MKLFSKKKPSKKLSEAKNKNLPFYKKKIFIIPAIIVGVLLILAIIGFFMISGLFNKVNKVPIDDFSILDSIKEEEGDDPNYDSTKDDDVDAMQYPSGSLMQDSKIMNILLIGSDSRGELYGRSDVMMIVTIDYKHKKIKMTSILRDLYVKIPGKNDNRINAAHAYGGPKLLKETIEKNFLIKIDNYVRMDFSSFEKIIDILGGVPINISQNESDYLSSFFGLEVPAGTSTLNGKEALSYSRIRKIDSDFQRTQRQRNVINSLITKFKGSSPTTMWSFLNEALPYVQTDLSNSQLWDITTDCISIMNYSTAEMQAPINGLYESKRVRGMAVLVPDIEKTKDEIQKFIYE